MDPPITLDDFLNYENCIAVTLQNDTATQELIATLNYYSYLDTKDEPISLSGYEEDRVLVARPDPQNQLFILKPRREVALSCGYKVISASDILPENANQNISEILNLLEIDS